MARAEGTVLSAADSSTESPTSSDRLMESICDPDKPRPSRWRKVIANGGAPGVDGMRVTQLEKYFERHRDRIIGELLTGTYRPQPVHARGDTQTRRAECGSLAFRRRWIA